MRRLLPFCLVVLVFPGYAARSAAAHPPADPWCGTYAKLEQHGLQSPDGRAPRIEITRQDDGYHLSKPYDSYTFSEVEKGVLQDRNKVLGKIFLGSAQFAGDSKKSATVLRAEFCYEVFLLWR